MEKNLNEFYKKLKKVESLFAITEYKDEEGNIKPLPTSALLLNCEYQEIEEPTLKSYQFSGVTEKDEKFEKIKKTTHKVKSDVTHKKSDEHTIIDVDVDAYKVWLVSNSLGLKKAYNNQDDATNFVEQKNSEIYEILKESMKNGNNL